MLVLWDSIARSVRMVLVHNRRLEGRGSIYHYHHYHYHYYHYHYHYYHYHHYHHYHYHHCYHYRNRSPSLKIQINEKQIATPAYPNKSVIYQEPSYSYVV
jgi:hypothetical protein